MKILISILMFFITIPISKTYSNSASYCIVESNSLRILDSSNEHEVKLIASTTKILTCLVAIENLRLNNYCLILEEDVNMDGSKIYMDIGDSIRVIDLLYGLMLRSGNDCANAIARYYGYDEFIELMNERCKEIGMTRSSFNNPSGLDNDDYYNLSTAFDMSILMVEAMKNDIFREITGTIKYQFNSLNDKKYYLFNKHKLVKNYDEFIGGKTGYTKKSGRVLVSYGVINNMSVSITTIGDSNDWQTHINLLNKSSNYTNTYVIDSGKYDIGNGYYIFFDKSLVIPIKDEEKRKIKLVVKNKYLYAFLEDKVILKYRIIIKHL